MLQFKKFFVISLLLKTVLLLGCIPILKSPVVLLMGPPGAGKGTQAAVLMQKYHLVRISMGDLLREEVKLQTPMGKKVEVLMAEGGLVPSEYVNTLLANKIKTIKPEEGILFDGFPRKVEELENLDSVLAANGRKVDVSFYFDFNQEEAIERISGRRVCTQCKANFHLTNQPPKVSDVCDHCGSPLMQRPDDNPAAIQDRYLEYYQQTFPVIEALRKRKVLTTLEATKPVDEVTSKIVEAMNKLGS